MNAAMGDWGRLAMLVGAFFMGVGVGAIGLWALYAWAVTRPYMPGPFWRQDLEDHERAKDEAA